MSAVRHRRRQSVLVPVNPNAYNTPRRGSAVSYVSKSNTAKAKPTVTARYSSDTLKVVEGGSSGFYSVHFQFTTPPTHPIIVSPMTNAHTLRIYPPVIKFNPEDAHLPQFFRVSVLHETDDDTRAPMTLEHSVQSIDPSFCGYSVMHEPKILTVAIFHGGGKYLMSTGDGTSDSSRGQLGLGSRRSMAKPGVWNGIDVDGRLHSKLFGVACGAAHTVVITDDGEVLTWGDNDSGQLGNVCPTLSQMACGLKHTMALLDTGAVVSWGYGKSGALGHGNRDNVDGPKEVVSLRGQSVFQVDLKGKLCSWVACGGAHTMCLTDQYDVLAFGANTFGQLGVGDCRDRAYPVEVVFFRKVRLAISDDRLLYAWGNGEQGQCGLGTFPHIYTLPQLVRHNEPSRDEHWRLRQKQLVASDKAHRDAIRKHLDDKTQQKFHDTMHGNHPFLAVLRQLHQSSPLALAHVQLKTLPSADAIAAAVKRSGLSRQRSLDKLKFVVDPATMTQVELKVHSPHNKTLTNPRCHSANLHGPVRTSQMLAQSPSLQRALKSAAALQTVA
ncbi:hypothetical protein DYB30_001831 [Aphanomyces astaci]|uniref:Uncharacterized protein n=1 Tax=Aphanomyces astaci TaxID=112090 RepID=A0A397DAY6_APHAT|nr:hypothetical protein DYB30_001831 [Aphanomyces astaci]